MLGGGGGNASNLTSKDESTTEVAPVVAVWNKDPFMRIKKNTSVPKMRLVSSQHFGENEEDEEKIPITRPRSVRKS